MKHEGQIHFSKWNNIVFYIFSNRIFENAYNDLRFVIFKDQSKMIIIDLISRNNVLIQHGDTEHGYVLWNGEFDSIEKSLYSLGRH